MDNSTLKWSPQAKVCRGLTFCGTVLVMLAFAGVEARAATQNVYTWDGGAGTSNWFDAANWSGDAIPGTSQNGSTIVDQATIGNVSGTINYTPGTPTSFDYLSITATTSLTVNLNGNLTTTHLQSTAVGTPNYGAVADVIGGAGGSLIFNVKSGTYAIQNIAFGFNGSQFNIDAGASVITQAAGTIQSNRPTTLGSGTMTVRGTLTNFPGNNSGTASAITRGAGLILNNGDVVVDGGTANLNAIGFQNVASLSNTRTFSLANNGAVNLYFGQASVIGGNNNTATGYDTRISVSSGTFTNNDAMLVGAVNSGGATRPGTGRITLTGGVFNQNGAMYIGDGRVGIVDISGGSTTFTSRTDVFVGGGRTSTDAPTTAATSGTLTISSGTVTISNPGAGTVRTATQAGRTNPSSNTTHFFGVTNGTWDNEYTGQRVVFDSLSGAGAGLSTGTVYFTMDPNPVGINAFSTFGVATTSGGLGITGASGYTGATYRTLGARLLVGNTMTFSGTSFVIPGTLNLSGGRLVVDEFVANQGANSTINFTGGSFRINTSSDVNTGSQLQVGNGTLAAVLDIAGGTNAFAQGLRFNNNATLMGSGTITAGTVTIASGGIHSPGNSPGIQTVANETWQTGGIYLWEINDLSGVAGTNWDQINVTGLLDLSGLSEENPFILDLTTLTLANTPGALATPFDNGTYVFQIASYGSLDSPLGTAALTDLSDLFDIRFTNWVSPQPTGGSVRINSSGTGLELVIVPEPGALALAGIGIAVAAWAARRRRIMPH